MKNNLTAESREPRAESRKEVRSRVFHLRPAFTLIELLVVIAIIAVLAALIFPLAGVVKRKAYVHNAEAQLAQLETAIDHYKSVYGFYPPGSRYGPVTNQLYYELEGTMLTNKSGTVYFTTLDHGASISSKDVPTAFGVSGFMNCDKPGADESAPSAQNFLPDLNTNQVAAVTVEGVSANFLVTPVGGPESSYAPMGSGNSGINPWRYRSSGTLNNPGSYDLWIQLEMGSETNLICNWTRQVQVNTAYP